MIKKLFTKILISLKSQGISRSIFWLFFGYFQINDFAIFRKENDAAEDIENQSGLILVSASANDIERLKNNPDFQTPEAFISSHIRTSGCFLGIMENTPVHVMWVFKSGDESRFFDLKKGEAELNYCYTPGKFRGKGIYASMINKAVQLLKSQGIRTVYMATHSTNAAAKKAIRKAAFHEAGTLRHYGIFFRPKYQHPG
jgi:RimJ/RimL family protein N-acetyltransferase